MREHIAQDGARELIVTRGNGSHLFDDKGRKYLDFTAGWCVANVGYGHPDVRRAMMKAAKESVYVAPLFRFRQAEDFAKELLKIAPLRGKGVVYRCTSGSEANEYAIQCARSATGKTLVIAVDGVYHGHTYGALAISKNYDAKLLGPKPEGYATIPLPKNGEEGERSLAALRRLLDEHKDDVALFISEPVWSNAGVRIPPKGFFARVQELCRAHGVLFAMDEVAVGCGRCGRMFASELWDLEPDIITLGKGFTGGYATMAAALITKEIADKAEGVHDYDTFGWLWTDLAATRAVVDVIRKKKLWKNADAIGRMMLERLQTFREFPFVVDVRGVGLLLGVEIESKETANGIVDACQKQGLLIEMAGQTLFLSPPLTLKESDMRRGVDILEKVLRELV